MPENRREEFLSEAYIRAIAARAGVNIQEFKADFGVDIGFTRINHHSRGFTDMSCLPLYCQLKASTTCETRGDQIVYKLDAKNYNDLVSSSSSVLIVFCLPPDINDWIAQDEHCLSISKCAYYLQLTDREETPNKATKTITIPKAQIFTEKALLQLIDEVQKRVQPL